MKMQWAPIYFEPNSPKKDTHGRTVSLKTSALELKRPSARHQRVHQLGHDVLGGLRILRLSKRRQNREQCAKQVFTTPRLQGLLGNPSVKKEHAEDCKDKATASQFPVLVPGK